jgi:hypothetical protein
MPSTVDNTIASIAQDLDDAPSVGDVSAAPDCATAERCFVPDYIECITVMIDDDQDGRRRAETLTSRLI